MIRNFYRNGSASAPFLSSIKKKLPCRNSQQHRSFSSTIFDIVKSGEIHDIGVEEIRNFSVIAHIDRKMFAYLCDCHKLLFVLHDFFY